MSKLKLFETSRSILKKDPAAKSLLEVVLLYPGVHALAFYRVAHLFYKVKLIFIARLLSQVARFLTGIEIHPGAQIGKRLFIDHGMGLVIGETTIIGDDCTLYHGVTLGGKSSKDTKRHPTLKNNVVVGANAQIIGPVVLHDYCIVGANALVTKDVVAHDIVGGVPAKSIKR